MATVGLEAQIIDVEVDVGAGIPSLTIVGLPDKAVEESKERVRLALKNSGFDFPQKKIVVNLAPADIKKEGPSYDLPIAIGVLVASGVIAKEKIENCIFLGELSLGGQIKPVKAVVQAAILAKKNQAQLVIPADNEQETSLVSDLLILPSQDLKTLIGQLVMDEIPFLKTSKVVLRHSKKESEYDFSNITGQFQAKRALEIAAAGGHNILLSGSPGGGKTLLSRAINTILPPLSEQESLEVTKLYSLSGLLSKDKPFIVERPFRSPHHTTSAVALIGGGAFPKPGEVSLSDKGVLFLDEFPEFPRSVLEALRQPLEDKIVTISRAQGSVNFPADFILVAAQNPCPCGYYLDEKIECRCTNAAIIKYKNRVSGPLLDRIDLHIKVNKMAIGEINTKSKSEPSSKIALRVQNARTLQIERSKKILGHEKINGLLSHKDLEKVCLLSEETKKLLTSAIENLNLSMRSYVKTLRVARTIADLQSSKNVKSEHVSEALQYRIGTKDDF